MGKNARRRNAAREARRPRGESGEPKGGARRRRRLQNRVFDKIMRRVRGPSPVAPEEKITTVAPQPKRRPTAAEDIVTAEQLGFGRRPSGLIVPSTPSPDTQDEA